MHAFEVLLDAICSPLVLALTKSGCELSIGTAASDGRICVALFQTEDDDLLRQLVFVLEHSIPQNQNFSCQKQNVLR